MGSGGGEITHRVILNEISGLGGGTLKEIFNTETEGAFSHEDVLPPGVYVVTIAQTAEGYLNLANGDDSGDASFTFSFQVTTDTAP